MSKLFGSRSQILAACAVLGYVWLCGTAQAQRHVMETSVCEVQASPDRYDGKIVRLRATVLSGFEVFAIRQPDKECGLALEYPGGGPVASVSFGANTPTIQRTPVLLKHNAKFKKFEQLLSAEMFPKQRGHSCIACKRYEVTARMVGRVDYAGEHKGFGHLNMFPLRFVLESVTDIEVKDLSSQYDPSLFSSTKVRLPTGYVHGRLIQQDGRIIEGAEINAVSVEDVPPYMKSFTEWTDNKGAFKFDLPPGRYLIGLNLDTPASPAVPYPATYYPSTNDRASAKELIVRDRAKLSNVNIRLGEPLRPRSIRVKAVWPDGQPIREANVWLSDVRDPTAVVGTSVSHTAEDGTFELVGFEGIDYFVRANIYVKPRYLPHCARNVLLKADTELNNEIVMSFTRTGDVCRSLMFDMTPAEEPR